MRKLLLILIGALCLTAAQAQTKHVVGRIHDPSPAGKQVDYYYFVYDSLGAIVDSDTGAWFSNASGFVNEDLNISVPYKYGAVFFEAPDCRGSKVYTADSLSDNMWGDSLVFDLYTCDDNKLNLSGSFFHQPGYYPAKNAMIYIYVDSTYSSSPTMALVDSVSTDTLGSYARSIILPFTWNNGSVWISFGCPGNRSLKSFYYSLNHSNGLRTQNLYTGALTYCMLPTTVVHFDGVVTDSLGTPLSNYTFSVNVDSINHMPDTMIHTRVVTTNASGAYSDSLLMPAGTNDVHLVYYLASCDTLITLTDNATLVLNRASVTKNIQVCGSYEWQIHAFATIAPDPGSTPQGLVIDVMLTDTLGNYIDSFQVYKSAGTSLAEAYRQVGGAHHAADISFRFTDCNGLTTTTPGRGRMGQVNHIDLGDYKTCVPFSDSALVYLHARDTFDNRTGVLYLITATVDTSVTPLDTILTLVDSFIVNNRYYAVAHTTYTGVCYMKFAPTPADPLYSQLLPTYWGVDSPLTWRDADPFTFSSITGSMILNIRTGTNLGGPGFISGSLASGAGKKANPTANVTVLLYDQHMKPVRFATSNSGGTYEFADLAAGTYYLMVDVPGRDMTPYQVVINQAPYSAQADFVVRSKTIVAKQTTAVGSVVKNIRAIYPNPAQDKVMISFDHQGAFTLEIYNLLGEQVYQQPVNGNQAEVSVSNWTPGTYLVRLQDTASGQLWLGKLLVH